MNQGITPCDKRRDSYISMKVYDKFKQEEVTWAPTNANGYFTDDMMPLKAAFAQSINSVAVRLGQEVGIDKIAKTAQAMGIKSPLDNTPSLALGASDVNLLELVNSYATVANDGKMHEPVLVTKILDRNGKEIYSVSSDQVQAIPYKSAFFMQQMLMGGMREPGGTSQSLWRFVGKHSDTEFGGKTGTSNNHSDAWFVGVCPKLVAGAWVGGEYRSIHFRTGALGQGSRTALPICGYFFESVFDDPAFKKYHGKFSKASSDIPADAYNSCSGYYHKRDMDSLSVDSIMSRISTVMLDEDGNAILHEGEAIAPNKDSKISSEPTNGTNGKQGEATENKRRRTTIHEEDVFL